MKTKKRAEFFRDCRDLLSLIHRRRPTAIPAALVTALLESAPHPFLSERRSHLRRLAAAVAP